MNFHRILLIFIVLSFLIFPNCKTAGGEEDVDFTIYKADIKLDDYSQTMEDFDRVSITGKVINEGNRTGYNILISFSAYDSSDTIIDTAKGFPADLGDVPINVKAEFNAVFFNLENWDRVDKIKYSISWLNKNGTHIDGSNSGELTLNDQPIEDDDDPGDDDDPDEDEPGDDGTLPTCKYFKAEPNPVNYNQTTIISWKIENAIGTVYLTRYCEPDCGTCPHAYGNFSSTGSTPWHTPYTDSTYKLTATNNAGSVTFELFLKVNK